jgi:ribosomal protein S27AE
MEKIVMKYCPRCGSSDIEWVLPQDWSKWECKHCGYIGPVIIEDGELAVKIKEDYEKHLKKRVEEEK